MSIDDYRQAHSPQKKSTDKNRMNQISLIFFATLFGFFGGLVALRFSPDLVSDSANITEHVVSEEGEIIADIAERVGPSVVSINVTSVETTFSPFYGESSYEAEGAGTGIILTKDGLIVTNNHVIPEDVSEVTVTLNDGTSYEDVQVIGREAFNDIAYLQIEGVDDLQPAALGDSDEVRVGERVVAIGNALGEFDTTVTSGIISGQGRPIVAGTGSDSELLVNLFQTDASINPGNSGGPLLNINGEVIAINTAVAGDAENIGFAIPINDVKPGITSIEDNGELIRPYLGVRYVTLTPEIAEELDVDTDEGALIYDSNPDDAIVGGSPAEKAGLQNRDVIKKVDGETLTEDRPLPNLVSRHQVGDVLTLTVLRDGSEIDVEITLERVPENL